MCQQFWISSLAISPHILLSNLHGLWNHHFAANSFAIIAKRQTADRKDIITGITWRIWTSSATLFLSLARLNENYNCAFVFLSLTIDLSQSKCSNRNIFSDCDMGQLFEERHLAWMVLAAKRWLVDFFTTRWTSPNLNITVVITTTITITIILIPAKSEHQCHSDWRGHFFGHMLTSDCKIWPNENGRFSGHPRPPRIISNGPERVRLTPQDVRFNIQPGFWKLCDLWIFLGAPSQNGWSQRWKRYASTLQQENWNNGESNLS